MKFTVTCPVCKREVMLTETLTDEDVAKVMRHHQQECDTHTLHIQRIKGGQ